MAALDITVIVDISSAGSTAADIWHDFVVFIRFRTGLGCAGTHLGYLGMHDGDLAIAVGGIRLAGIFRLDRVTYNFATHVAATAPSRALQ